MPDPEQLAAMLEAHRRTLLAWAPVMCSCSFLRFRPGRPVFADCPVHSEYVILPDGSIL